MIAPLRNVCMVLFSFLSEGSYLFYSLQGLSNIKNKTNKKGGNVIAKEIKASENRKGAILQE